MIIYTLLDKEGNDKSRNSSSVPEQAIPAQDSSDCKVFPILVCCEKKEYAVCLGLQILLLGQKQLFPF